MMVLSWWCCCRVVVTLVVWATTIAAVAGATPALPAGGGGHQTIAGRSSDPPSPSLIHQLERSLLSMFGMQQRPRVKRGAVPPYMMELYHRQAGLLISSSAETIDSSTTTTTTTTTAPPLEIHNTNTVRSFTHKESPADAKYPSNKMRFHFNVSNIAIEEILQSAELRLSHMRHPAAPELLSQEDKVPGKLHRRKKWSSADVPYLQRVMVYDILRRATPTSDPAIQLLDTQVIDARREGTQTLDVSDALQRWISNPRANFGLLVEVVPLKQTTNAVDTSHIHLRRSSADTQWHERQPLLVIHTNDGKSKTRSKRSATIKHKKVKNYCKRYPLYVDFRKVGWDDWIVAPAGYEAFFCKGDCPFPLSEEMNATNHAVVQTLVNSRYPDRVPKACCVPTELSAISMLYMDDDERFVLKNHQDMVVEGCGCR